MSALDRIEEEWGEWYDRTHPDGPTVDTGKMATSLDGYIAGHLAARKEVIPLSVLREHMWTVRHIVNGTIEQCLCGWRPGPRLLRGKPGESYLDHLLLEASAEESR